MNEVYWILNFIISFGMLLLFYKCFGKVGLYLWISIATIITNIQTVKLVNLFDMETSLGTILYGTTFIATDILNEKYGENNAKRGVLFGFLSMIVMTVLMFLSLQYTPSKGDFASKSLSLIFNLNIRITLGSLFAYICSQWMDTKLYQFLKRKKTSLWIRNNFSTMLSQMMDTIIFTFITYYGVVSNNILLNIGLTMYVFKFIIFLLDTPFMYFAVKIRPKEERENEKNCICNR